MYFEPDPTWTAFGIKTQEEYLERYVFKGKFHAQVHEDVTKSYETSEYLMAHAYYHYRMYDEALKKLLGIFEMAVKLRCQELQIEIDQTNKRGETKARDLYLLINDLVKTGYPEALKRSMDRLRKLRNMFSHPKKYGFAGGTLAQNMIPIINVLNQLFLPASYFKEQQDNFERMKNELEKIQHHLFVLPFHEHKILAFSPELISSVNVHNAWYYFLNFKAVVKDPQTYLDKNRSLDPVYINLKDLQISSIGFEGLIQPTNTGLKVEVTLEPENLEKWTEHKLVFDNLTPEQRIGLDLRSGRVYDALNKFIYENCWNSEVKPA